MNHVVYCDYNISPNLINSCTILKFIFNAFTINLPQTSVKGCLLSGLCLSTSGCSVLYDVSETPFGASLVPPSVWTRCFLDLSHGTLPFPPSPLGIGPTRVSGWTASSLDLASYFLLLVELILQHLIKAEKPLS